LFAAAGLIAKADPLDIASALLLTAALAGAFLLAGAIPCFRFVRMIRLQEAMFQTAFDDDCAVELDRVGLTYVSKDWFIRSVSRRSMRTTFVPSAAVQSARKTASATA
jgi:hypothetical protein